MDFSLAPNGDSCRIGPHMFLKIFEDVLPIESGDWKDTYINFICHNRIQIG